MPRKLEIGTVIRRAWVLAAAMLLAPGMTQARPPPAPEFTHKASADWLNSKPLRLANLKGQPVLIEFWAFECVNCLRSAAWLHAVNERYRDQGLVIVAVHTPELPQERAADNVRAAVDKLGIDYPVMLDADYSYWNAMGNRYWPAFYLIDASGRIAAQTIGEMHVGESRAEEFEREIEKVVTKR
jgi:thiol-disulfide isomerase/thioredoxin